MTAITFMTAHLQGNVSNQPCSPSARTGRPSYGYNGASTATRIIKPPQGDSNYAQLLEQRYNPLKD
jgi:hypothetical protein